VIELVVFGAVLVGYALVSARLDGTPLTAPMVFTGAGMAVALAGGSLGIDVADSDGTVHLTETAKHVAEIALVLLLFTGAARIDVRALGERPRLPLRLLALGLPLTIALGSLVALVLFGELDFWEACILGAVLAPTDAALGQVVVSSPKLPERLRRTLDVEAGLNDGLTVPFFTVFAALAVDEELGNAPLARAILEKLADGALIGAGIGVAGGLLLREASKRGWSAPPFEQLALLAIALLAWWVAEDAGGSGLIAAFVGGMALGAVDRRVADRVLDFTADFGQLLSLLVFYALGVTVVELADLITWEMAVYTALSLTVIRMLPVALALLRAGLEPWTVAYLGWFGPRGLASILLALILLLEYPGLPGGGTIFVAVMVAVVASVFLHGVTAAPLTDRYARTLSDDER
jgi:NhaP-type Na+/H+ or K+/H+ antiporter